LFLSVDQALEGVDGFLGAACLHRAVIAQELGIQGIDDERRKFGVFGLKIDLDIVGSLVAVDGQVGGGKVLEVVAVHGQVFQHCPVFGFIGVEGRHCLQFAGKYADSVRAVNGAVQLGLPVFFAGGAEGVLAFQVMEDEGGGQGADD